MQRSTDTLANDLNWLARRARLPGMKSWFTAMAAAERCGLCLHRAELGPTLQTDVIVRGFLAGQKGHIDFRLSSNKPLFHCRPLCKTSTN